MHNKDEQRVLRGEFDTDRGGRKAGIRNTLRDDVAKLVDVSHWSDSEWVLLTEQDFILILQATARIQTQASKWVETRSRQGRQWGLNTRRISKPARTEPDRALVPSETVPEPVVNTLPNQIPITGVMFWNQSN